MVPERTVSTALATTTTTTTTTTIIIIKVKGKIVPVLN
jgi:hypothetical protein